MIQKSAKEGRSFLIRFISDRKFVFNPGFGFGKTSIERLGVFVTTSEQSRSNFSAGFPGTPVIVFQKGGKGLSVGERNPFLFLLIALSKTGFVGKEHDVVQDLNTHIQACVFDFTGRTFIL